MRNASACLVDCCEEDGDTSDEDDPSESSTNVSRSTISCHPSQPSLDSLQQPSVPPQLLAPLDRALSHKLVIRSPRFSLRAISMKGRQSPLGANMNDWMRTILARHSKVSVRSNSTHIVKPLKYFANV
ncbi:unnamed protein product [Strongylus vulgaris]|uniref:Uncharacterized protein n=1 Tax=Strongylus vulgaris TaxID=40348 RepID=A0A3P7II12_STRVU|nr:unnamed protein product [Strongylus vulgaris]